MNKEDFDQFILRIKNAPIPKCPASLEKNVLRRIKGAIEEPSLSIWDWLLGIAPRPQFIFTAVALTLTVSLSSALISTGLSANVAQKDALASKALGFDVFHGKDLLNLDDK